MEPWYKVVLPWQELREGRSLEGVRAAIRGIR